MIRQRRFPVADDLDDDYLTDKDDVYNFGLGKGITLKDLATIGRIQDEESDEIDVDDEDDSQNGEDEDDEEEEDLPTPTKKKEQYPDITWEE